MKNFIYYFFLFLVFCFNKKIHSQCNRPSSVGNSISSITTSWGSRTGNTNKRIDFSATAGRTYTFSLCSDDGATCDFDSQMAIRLNSSPYTVQASNDDYCGLDSKIIWNCTNTANYEIYINEYDCLTSTSNTFTLYHKYTATSYTITYNNNGGSGSMSSTSGTLNLTVSSNTFTKTGYTFTGWNTSSDGSGTSYANGDTYSTASNVTLYAQWQNNYQWVGSSSTDWNNSANWYGGAIPGVSSDVVIPNGSGLNYNPKLGSSGDVCGSLTVQSGGILTSDDINYKLTATSVDLQSGGSIIISNGELNCTGKFDHDGGLTISGSGVLDIDGEYESSASASESISGGTIEVAGEWDGANDNAFTPSGGTVIMNGSSNKNLAQHSSSNFHNLTIGNSSGDVDVTADLDIDGDLTINSGADLDIGGGNANVELSGNFTNNGTFTTSGETITFDGAAGDKTSTAISDASLDIVINKTSTGKVTFAGTCSFDEVTVTDGILAITSNTLTADNTVSIADGAELEIGTGTFNADATFNANSSGIIDFTDAGKLVLSSTVSSLGALDDAAGTVEYDNSSATSILSDTYYNLELDGNGSGNKTAAGDITVNGTFTIQTNCQRYRTAGYTTSVTGATVLNSQLKINNSSGIFDANGSFDASNGSIEFSADGFLKLSQSPSSLGNLDDAQGTVVYDGGTQNILADSYFNLEIDQSGTKTSQGTVTVAGNMTVQSSATYAVAATTTTVTGTSDINGTTSISTGTYNADGSSDVDGTISITGTGKYDADAAFDATSGNVTFTGAGRLECSNTVTSLGTLSTGAGTVEYDGGSQNVLADAYYNLEIDQSGTKTSQGTITVAGDMTVQSGATYAVAATTITVTGTSDIDGTTTISTGTYNADGSSDVDGTISITGTGKYDADAAFDASSGNVTFTGAGRLECSNTVTSLGTLSTGAGTVEYDGGTQDVLADAYYNIEIDQSGVKTSQGTVTAAGTMTVQTGATYAVAATTTTVTGTSDIDGTTTISTGTYNADGSSDVDGTISITGTGKYDADAAFDASSGNVTFTGAGRLECSNTVTSLGTLSTGAGTVEYDGSAQSILSDTYYNLELGGTGTASAAGNVTCNGTFTLQSSHDKYNLSTHTHQTTGATDINDEIEISTGIYDADGSFDATGGTIDFTGSGTLKLASTVTSLGTLDNATGTVEYDGADQSIFAATYNNLELGGTGTASAAGNITCNGTFTLQSSHDKYNLSTHTHQTTGATDINDEIEISTGIYDADGSFDATGGTIDFTGSGTLRLGGAVASLGTLDAAAGKVEYDLATQSVLADVYNDLTISTAGVKSAAGDITVNNDLVISNTTDCKLDMQTNDLTIKGDLNVGAVNGLDLTDNLCDVTLSGSSSQSITHQGSTSSSTLLSETFSSGTISEGNGSSFLSQDASNSSHSGSWGYWRLSSSDLGSVSCSGCSSYRASIGSGSPTGGDSYLWVNEFTPTTNTVSISFNWGFYNRSLSSDGNDRFKVYLDPNSGSDIVLVNITHVSNSYSNQSYSASSSVNAGTTYKFVVKYENANYSSGIYGASIDNILITEQASSSNFKNLTLNNSSGFIMSSDLEISGALTLTSGSINTNGNTLHVTASGSVGGSKGTSPCNCVYPDAYSQELTTTSAVEFRTGNSTGTERKSIWVQPENANSVTFSADFEDNVHTDASDCGAGLDHISSASWYNLSRTAGTENAKVKIGWYTNDQVDDYASLLLAHYDGSQWQKVVSTPTGSNTSGTIISDGFQSSFSPFALGSSNSGNALPIDLLSFGGECENGRVQLEFVVASQVNNDYFTIERSVDAYKWNEVGVIAGEGNTNTQVTYNWTDDNPFNGVSYYRLAQTDYDGTTKRFDPIAVSCESSVTGYSVYPNPANEVLNIDIELTSYQGNNVEIEIMDINGRKIQSQNAQLDRGYNHLEVDLSEIPSGVYMINFSGTKDYIKESRIIKK